MRTAEEILKEGNEGHPIRTIIDNLTDDDILDVIATAQKEAYNEAINDASKQVFSNERPDLAQKHRNHILELLKK